jgi:hypothetical protein
MLAITNLSGTHERGHPGMPQAWRGRWAIFGFFFVWYWDDKGNWCCHCLCEVCSKDLMLWSNLVRPLAKLEGGDALISIFNIYNRIFVESYDRFFLQLNVHLHIKRAWKQ